MKREPSGRPRLLSPTLLTLICLEHVYDFLFYELVISSFHLLQLAPTPCYTTNTPQQLEIKLTLCIDCIKSNIILQITNDTILVILISVHQSNRLHLHTRQTLSETRRQVYLPRSSVSSTEKDINTRLTKAWTAIDKLSIIWKSDLTDKMKRSFFQAAVVSILLYGCTT